MTNRAKKRSRPSTPETGDSSKPVNSLSGLAGVLGLVALATVPFVLSIGGKFVFDDRKTILENGVVRGTKPLIEVFTTDYWGDQLSAKSSHKSYRPLTTLTFWLNHRLHGLWTPGYHIINILLHTINTLLVHRLATVVARAIASGPTTGYGSWAAAAAFAVHPVHVEAVANVSGRAELLSGMFYLASILLYLGSEPGKLGTVPRNIVYAILVMLSVASKEQGITAPIACVALEWTLRGRRLSIKRAAANALLVAAIAVVRLWLNDWSAPRFSPHDNPAAFMATPLLRAVNYAHYWFYSLSLLLLPSSFSFDYSMGCFPPIVGLSDYRILSTVSLAAIGVTVTIALIIVEERMRRWMLSIGILTVVPFLPASNLLVTVGFTVAERVLYLPSIGMCLLLPTVIKALRNRVIDKSLKSLGWTVLIIAVAISAQRSYDWRSSLVLFSKDLAVCPNNAKIHYNLGKVLADLGSFQEAELRYREALRLHPVYESALNNLGNLLEARGRKSDAEECLKEAIRVAPSFAAAWMNLGIAQMRAGKYNMSEASLAHSITLRPMSAEAHFNLGVLQLRVGRQDAARAAWMRATSLDSSHSRAWSNLFVLLDEMERCDEVIDLSGSALEHNADLASLRLSIGTCYAKRGDFIEAERELHRAVQLSPSTAIYHANLGVLYQRWHRYEEAIRTYSTALDLDPTVPSIRENLETTRRRLNQTRN